MTTLAWRAGVLAADSQGTIGGTIVPGACRKVWRSDDGRLIGVTGETAQWAVLVRILLAGATVGDLPKVTDARVVVVHADGRVIVHEGESWYDCGDAPYLAWGSGMDSALGAMAVGASAKRAVEAAISCDVNSGGDVQYVSLRRPK